MSNYQDEKWTPHPRQQEALERTESEILYGGARGGGKTDCGINWLLYDVHNPKLRALIIRRNAKDLEDWVDRANQIYSRLGAVKRGNPGEFVWSSGAIFRTGHLKDADAYTKYQGHEYHRMVIEELNQIPTEKAYLRLLSSCRSTVLGLRSQVFCTTNPGGIGHAWIKKRFVDIAPWGEAYKYKATIGDKIVYKDRIFIHATIDDNPTLLEADPEYVATLEQLKDTDPELYKAWRFGDWDVFAGQVFGEFNRDKHIIKRVLPSQSYTHFLGIDWGYSGRDGDEGAFAAHAGCIKQEKYIDIYGDSQYFNRVIIYKEWYGKGKTPDEWAEIMYKDSKRKYKSGWADSAMFNTQTDGSRAISELMEEKWDDLNDGYYLRLKRGTRNRISRVATLHNWLSLAPDGLPYLLIMENCIHLIRTIPLLVYDEHKVEDVETTGEDHLYDDLTYALAAIKFISAGLGGVNPPEDKKKVLPPILNALDLTEFEGVQSKVEKDWRV